MQGLSIDCCACKRGVARSKTARDVQYAREASDSTEGLLGKCTASLTRALLRMG